MAEGFTGISIAGRWECGSCAAAGDGWWDDEDGLTLEQDGEKLEEHVCDE